MTEQQRIEVLDMFPNIYNELFECKQDIANSFCIDIEVLENKQILYAFYEYEDYSGSASVLYYDPDFQSFFEVHGGHCSCYGLEGQWEPEEINRDFNKFKEYVTRQGYGKRSY
ncbi:hypothetical protein pEaSNUABM50_00379 [Erwinia phage pEa_SNUABM_50]|uniref:Uncharacterized protein n=4 Tax=Eneladusvirus BF TaxID=2560751 RepID=A0A7L8ZPJ0_9CAUD|nr:hypothetical protein FDH34_gp540 [Serratia phage BF]QOI71318.1 hypothetical protein pEaSNUABM12_00383 [Erwinia phage pEa_SNUABM_12]QOI71861.1 hypothetical protein pEaSNUABM47_00380 [Erwinia phage pEa_SNUABM_47]QOI72400.1 hypothetical protein pEaSNUABM50_00379 [Erwinia phage pEa_SNUABM_50]QXO11527.1 hypothetical protein pEaSNUABM19_00384 [Erwinia phage pEa_SNUABM_19]QXO12075.1 hypothetical protein pEaSNUABM44_00382 [Erwinia phage pEa_SNUABM_44]